MTMILVPSSMIGSAALPASLCSSNSASTPSLPRVLLVLLKERRREGRRERRRAWTIEGHTLRREGGERRRRGKREKKEGRRYLNHLSRPPISREARGLPPFRAATRK